MDNMIFNIINKYFNALHALGYMKYKDVYKMLFIIAVLELIYNEFKECVTEEDYKLIDTLVSNLYGTSCLIPYPEYCNQCSRKHCK